jgi:hypothetical protein
MLVTAILIVTAASCTSARRPHGVTEHQSRQRERIREGVDERDLTPREARRLRERSRDIGEDRRDALEDDGRIDARERRQIRERQRELSEDIYEQRHDDDVR